MWSEDDTQDVLAVLGISATASGGALQVVYDNAYQEALDTEQRDPVLRCSTADAERLNLHKKGAVITVSGTKYRVRRHEPDGTGMSRLILEI